MNEPVGASILHGRAEDERENAETEKSLLTSDEAITAYIKQGNFAGAAEAFLGKSIAYLHMADFSAEREANLSQARASIEESKSIIKEHGITSLDELVAARTGSLILEEGNFQDAYTYYKTAYDTSIKDQPLARQGNNLYHVGFIQFKLGNKEEGLDKIHQAINMIDDPASESINPKTKRTWKSGAYFRLADCLLDEGKVTDAENALGQAIQIIRTEPILSVRNRQIGKYEQRVAQLKAA